MARPAASTSTSISSSAASPFAPASAAAAAAAASTGSTGSSHRCLVLRGVWWLKKMSRSDRLIRTRSTDEQASKRKQKVAHDAGTYLYMSDLQPVVQRRLLVGICCHEYKDKCTSEKKPWWSILCRYGTKPHMINKICCHRTSAHHVWNHCL